MLARATTRFVFSNGTIDWSKHRAVEVVFPKVPEVMVRGFLYTSPWPFS